MKLLFLISTLLFAKSDMKSLGGSMYGEKMSVEYFVLNTGRHVLKISEFTGTIGKKAQLKELKTMELDLKEGETLSPYSQFKCRRANDELVFATIDERQGKAGDKKHTFSPRKAWKVEPAQFDIVELHDLMMIKCRFEPDGD